MVDSRASVQSTFAQRVGAPAWLMRVTLRTSRWWLACGTAASVAAVAFALAWLTPGGMAALSDPMRVSDTFGRFISAVATASAIAVSVTTLTLGRELRGVHAIREHQTHNREFRDDIVELLGDRRDLPVRVAPLLGTLAEAVARQAGRIRQQASPEAAAVTSRGITLGELMDGVAKRYGEAGAQLLVIENDAEAMLLAAVEPEREVVGILVSDFSRHDALPEELRDELAGLDTLLRRLDVLVGYAKTLGTQWGFSLMSRAILLAAVPAIAASVCMSLLYNDGVIDALGEGGAGALVAAAIFVAVLPLALFVAYLLRFVVLHQYTLPRTAFLLGPDDRTFNE